MSNKETILVHKGKQMISEDKNIMSVQEGKGKWNKNLPIRSLDVAVRIKAYDLQYDAHSSTVTKSKAVSE